MIASNFGVLSRIVSKRTEICHLQLLSGACYLYSEKENMLNSTCKKLLLCHTEIASEQISEQMFFLSDITEQYTIQRPLRTYS